MNDAELRRLIAQQDGVVSRRQIAGLDGSPGDIERMLRRRELVRVVPGVFVNHTGEITWLQRAWVGCLVVWPAALDRGSALRAFAGPGWRAYDDAGPIQLAVDVSRHVTAPDGYQVRRVKDLDARARWNLGPPRLRIEEAAIDSAQEARTPFAAVQLLADLCQSRRTTARRMLTALDRRKRAAGRSWLIGVLADIAEGTCSVLERGYLTEVEAPHGLPHPQRQGPSSGELGRMLHDVDYVAYSLRVELDGRLFHDDATQRDRDLDRDLDSAVAGSRTVRLGWGQVFDRPCATARRVGRLLEQGGWPGRVTPCGDGCRAVA